MFLYNDEIGIDFLFFKRTRKFICIRECKRVDNKRIFFLNNINVFLEGIHMNKIISCIALSSIFTLLSFPPSVYGMMSSDIAESASPEQRAHTVKFSSLSTEDFFLKRTPLVCRLIEEGDLRAQYAASQSLFDLLGGRPADENLRETASSLLKAAENQPYAQFLVAHLATLRIFDILGINVPFKTSPMEAKVERLNALKAQSTAAPQDSTLAVASIIQHPGHFLSKEDEGRLHVLACAVPTPNIWAQLILGLKPGYTPFLHEAVIIGDPLAVAQYIYRETKENSLIHYLQLERAIDTGLPYASNNDLELFLESAYEKSTDLHDKLLSLLCSS